MQCDAFAMVIRYSPYVFTYTQDAHMNTLVKFYQTVLFVSSILSKLHSVISG